MFIFPAFMSPETAIIGVLLPFIGIPLALIAFVVWHVRKLNSMDRALQEILETLKND
jgi:flagellar biogenesis protein FliO